MLRMWAVSVLLILVVSRQAVAAPELTPSGVPRNLSVYSDNGAMYVDLVPSGCSTGRYVINSTHSNYDKIVAILLTAQVAERPVAIRFDGCNGNNQGQVVGVYLI